MHAERTAHLGALSPCVAGAGCAGAWSGSLIAPLRTQQVFPADARTGHTATIEVSVMGAALRCRGAARDRAGGCERTPGNCP